MEIPAKTYNEKFESFLKILESDDRFDNVLRLQNESLRLIPPLPGFKEGDI